jgi:pyruvate formate lyase activating enzyme
MSKMNGMGLTQQNTGIIFDIQRFSIHDGPGIRTAIFLKGCSLHCFWCHNPESIHPKPEIEFFPQRCIHCDICLTECPNHACSAVDGTIVHHADRCAACGHCQEFCFAEALVLTGREMTAQEVMAEVLCDRQFYTNSGGGVTLSGGEPVLQTSFSRAILEQCRADHIHTAIETAGNYLWEMVEALLPFTDLVMMDIKHLDPVKHRAATGASNHRILENARRLAGTTRPLLFRTPVVPTVNDSEAELRAIALFIQELIEARYTAAGEDAAPITYELLKFHKLAGDKYRSLGVEYKAQDLEMLSQETMMALERVVQDVLGDRVVTHHAAHSY